MTQQKSKKQLTDAEYLEWRELTPEELAEHRERAKDAVIVEIEDIDPAR